MRLDPVFAADRRQQRAVFRKPRPAGGDAFGGDDDLHVALQGQLEFGLVLEMGDHLGDRPHPGERLIEGGFLDALGQSFAAQAGQPGIERIGQRRARHKAGAQAKHERAHNKPTPICR